MNDCITDRLQKLRDLRDKLCKKEKNWQEAFAARDWIVDQLSILHKMTICPDTDKEAIGERIADLLCVFEPEEKGSNHDE